MAQHRSRLFGEALLLFPYPRGYTGRQTLRFIHSPSSPSQKNEKKKINKGISHLFFKRGWVFTGGEGTAGLQKQRGFKVFGFEGCKEGWARTGHVTKAT